MVLAVLSTNLRLFITNLNMTCKVGFSQNSIDFIFSSVGQEITISYCINPSGFGPTGTIMSGKTPRRGWIR